MPPTYAGLPKGVNCPELVQWPQMPLSGALLRRDGIERRPAVLNAFAAPSLAAAGPASQIRHAALQTRKLLNRNPRELSLMFNLVSVGRFCVTPASQRHA